ncbi:MAG: hypothetical protein QHG98_06425 [Methanothrix sp.]|jgi:hypothetical protein|uniref:hypothetical protein n=1 Tax=Methanothrix sp. TaxID=90426 RepID=UPI00247CF64C|nr:hypothetical protein [Methanothrix sp.]
MTHGQEPYEIECCDDICWNSYYDNTKNTYNYTIDLQEIRRGEVCIKLNVTEDINDFTFGWWKEDAPFTYMKFYKNNVFQCEFIGTEWQLKNYTVRRGDELKWVFGIMSTIPKGRAVVGLPLQSRCPFLDIIVSDNTHCVNQTNLRAEISNINDATYQWSVNGNGIVSGQGTPSIIWNAGDNDTNLQVDVLRSNGARCSYRKVIPVNRACVYLNCRDNINGYVKNNTQIYLLPGGCRYDGDVKIEGVHDLSIKSAVADSKPEIFGRIELGNSSRILISGVTIRTPESSGSDHYTKAICTDKLNDSIISDNIIYSSDGFIFFNDSFRNTVERNIIYSNTINCLIGVQFSQNINISGTNRIYNNSNLYRIVERNRSGINSCIINQSRSCYSCTAADIRSTTTNVWGILNGCDVCR